MEYCSFLQDGSIRDEAVRTLYLDEATWTDPLTTSSGLESIVANYRSLPAVAASAQVEVLHATYTVKGENDAILRCEDQQYFFRYLLPYLNYVCAC
jgi:hypothetical protein